MTCLAVQTQWQPASNYSNRCCQIGTCCRHYSLSCYIRPLSCSSAILHLLFVAYHLPCSTVHHSFLAFSTSFTSLSRKYHSSLLRNQYRWMIGLRYCHQQYPSSHLEVFFGILTNSQHSLEQVLSFKLAVECPSFCTTHFTHFALTQLSFGFCCHNRCLMGHIYHFQ